LKSKLPGCGREWVRNSTLIIAWHLTSVVVDVRVESDSCGTFCSRF